MLTRMTLTPVATKVGSPLSTMAMKKGMLTRTVTTIAAERRCIRQKMQPITVIAMKKATCACS
ncbi:hypothetical protein D3C72_2563590 [compost metagenome]